MGCRGSFAIRHKVRTVQQYMHNGSDPTSSGKDLVKALKDCDVEAFKARFAQWTVVSEDEPPKARPAVVEKALKEGGATAEEARETRASVRKGEQGWYEVLRSAQGEFDAYLSGERTVFLDSGNVLTNFDTEWGYMLDLDEDVLVVYGGVGAVMRHKGLKAAKASPYAEFDTDTTYKREACWSGCAEITRIPFEDIQVLPLGAMQQMMDRIYRVY